jgi:hypothetical protein
MSAIVLRMAEVLALQWAFRRHIQLYRDPQSSVRDRTLDTSGPRATDRIKLGVGDGPWHGPDHGGRSGAADSLDTNVQGFQLLSNDVLRHPFAEILYLQPRAAILWQGMV